MAVSTGRILINSVTQLLLQDELSPTFRAKMCWIIWEAKISTVVIGEWLHLDTINLFSFGPSKRSLKSLRWKLVSILSYDAENSNRRGRHEVPLPWFDVYHFRNEKVTRGEMSRAIVSRIVTGDAPVSYWPILSPFQFAVQESLRKSTHPILKWQITP